MFQPGNRLRIFLILRILLIAPLSLSLAGCDSPAPMVIEEREPGEFDRIAEELAAQEQAVEEEP